MPSRLSFAVTLPIVLAIAPAVLAQTQQTAVSAEAPQKLVAEVIYNEMHDRERDSFWEYRSQRLEAGRELVREQVETAEGPVFRVLERGGVPLDNAARVSEEQRLSALVEHPGAMDKVRRAHEADEERLQKVMEMLPKAFLFTAGNPSGNVETIAFRPDPAFVPSGYEERIMHAMAGTITVDTRLKRMIAMRGTLVQRVDFGYGILGHVEQGGTFEIGRVQVSPEHWKTSLVEVHVEGKILLFKDVTKDQRETRTEFRPVSHEITLSQAKALLDKAAASSGSELASVASSH